MRASRRRVLARVVVLAALGVGACASDSDGPKGVFELPVDDVAAAGIAGSGSSTAGTDQAAAGSAGAPLAGSGTDLGVGGAAGVAGVAGSGVAGSGGTAGTGMTAGAGGVAGSGGEPVQPPATSTPLPCDVAGVFQSHCIMCHGSPLTGGAPMPLLTWEDLDAPARTAPTRKVRELVAERIGAGVRPMPPRPNPAVPADEVAIVTNWVGAGGQAGTDPACLLP